MNPPKELITAARTEAAGMEANGWEDVGALLTSLADALEILVSKAMAFDIITNVVHDPKYGRDAEWVRLNVKGALRWAEMQPFIEPDAEETTR